MVEIFCSGSRIRNRLQLGAQSKIQFPAGTEDWSQATAAPRPGVPWKLCGVDFRGKGSRDTGLREAVAMVWITIAGESCSQLLLRLDGSLRPFTELFGGRGMPRWRRQWRCLGSAAGQHCSKCFLR